MHACSAFIVALGTVMYSVTCILNIEGSVDSLMS